MAVAPLPSGCALELWVRRRRGDAARSAISAWRRRIPRYWADLPDDDAALRADRATARRCRSTRLRATRRVPAGRRRSAATRSLLPLGDAAASPDVRSAPVPQPRTALERDGLARSTPALFLDPRPVATARATRLLERRRLHPLSARRSPRRSRRHPRGARHRGSDAHRGAGCRAARLGAGAVDDAAAAPTRRQPPPQPAWGTFDCDCRTRAARRRRSGPRRGSRRRLDARCATRGTLHARLDGADAGDARSTLRGGAPRRLVATRADDRHGRRRRRLHRLRPRRRGDVLLPRARACRRPDAATGRPGARWSCSGAERLARAPRERLRRRHAARRAARAAAAGAPRAATCSRCSALPEHYRDDEALAHVARSDGWRAPSAVGDMRRSAAARAAKPRVSYGALYHPWLVGRDTAATRCSRCRRTAPRRDCSRARALTRGAWIAPANEPLRGVVALTPAIAPRPAPALLDAQVNVIRQEPRGFVPLGADTLSDDDDLRPINVRRLLILLRRLALRAGADLRLRAERRRVPPLRAARLRGAARELFERGAFAGAHGADALSRSSPTTIAQHAAERRHGPLHRRAARRAVAAAALPHGPARAERRSRCSVAEER